jgi:demethylmenaquinone methyltransferase/2-methoxy-6-polyprenyl-1,4-benzoquinol methylase
LQKQKIPCPFTIEEAHPCGEPWNSPYLPLNEVLMPATGAKPEGVTDEAGAARAVQQMFDSIAPRYDLLNHVLSANVDRLWWWRTARRFKSVLARPEATVLDMCCGTGDMTMALLKHRPAGGEPVVAADFSRGMLDLGVRKFAPASLGGSRAEGLAYAVPLEADALHLPLADQSMDLIVTAFGFRNLANYAAGLAEFHRVLKPGGQLGILEFSQPGGMLGKAYAFYFHHILPAIGRMICGKDGPYNYLPTSVGRFPAPPEMLCLMEEAGYADSSWTAYTFGIAGLYMARRSA